MNEDKKPNIFDFLDYRAYLHNYYTFMKKNTTFFSHRYFNNKAGIKSPNFFKNIIDGKKNLTKDSTLKFASALGLNKKETEYFENLVFFDQSKTSDKKQYYFERIKLLSKDIVKTIIEESQVGYFSRWYHCVVRELVVIRNYRDDFSRLANDVRPRITCAQARKSVQLLLELGLIVKKPDGTYVQTSRNISAGNNSVASMLIRQYHKNTLDNIKESLDSFPVHERTCTSLVMSITEEIYKELEEEIQEFRNRITHIANKSSCSDRVYQIAIQLFPVSSIEKRK